MTPLTRAANKDHEKNVESVLKKGVEEGRVYSYKVVPTYKDNTVPLKRSEGETDESFKTKKAIVKAESKIASKLDTEYTELRGKAGTKGDGIKHTYEVINKITPNKESKDYTLKGNTGSGPKPFKGIDLDKDSDLEIDKLVEILGVSKKLAALIKGNRPYSDSTKFYNKVLKKMKENESIFTNDIIHWKTNCDIDEIKRKYNKDKNIRFAKKNKPN